MKFNILIKYLKHILILIILIIFETSCAPRYTTYDKEKNLSMYHNDMNTNIFTEEMNQNIQQLQSNNIIYFSVDQYNIQPHFFHILNIHADFLCNHPFLHIRIEGHADERGTPEYNIALGERRSTSVKLYLQSKGVLSEQIFTISYGKEKPIVLGHNEEAYSKNRRAMLIYQ